MRIGMAISAGLGSLCLVFAACGGSDKPANATLASGNGTQAADDFDANKLTAIVLRPEDVPAGLAASGSFSPSTENGASFSTLYTNPSLYIQSTVGRISNAEERDSNFQHI